MDDPSVAWGDESNTAAEDQSKPKETPPLPQLVTALKNMGHLQPDSPSPLSSVGNSISTTSLLPPSTSEANSAVPEPIVIQETIDIINTKENANDHSVKEAEGPVVAEKPSVELEPPTISADFWVHVMFRLKDERDIRSLAGACKPLRKAVMDPSVIASWLLRKSTTYLAIYNAYRNFPSLLTVDVLRNMLSLGAHIPRYLALLIGYQLKELVATHQQTATDSGPVLGDFETLKTNQGPTPKLAGKKPVEDPPSFCVKIPETLERKCWISIGAVHFIVWIGTLHYGNLFGFNPDAPVSVASPRLKRKDDDASTIAMKSTQLGLFRQTLEWMYNLPGSNLPGSPINISFEVNKHDSDHPPSDAEVFAYMISLYRTADNAPAAPVAAPVPTPAITSRMPPSSSSSSSTTNSASSSPKHLPTSIMPPSKSKLPPPKKKSEPAPASTPAPDLSKSKLLLANRQTIISSLRELCNDVELAWFLIRHSGDAKPAILDEDRDDATVKTLLGYRIHLNLTHPSLPPTTTDEYFPVASIQRLVQQNRIKLTDKVLYILLSEHPTQLVISRLLRLGVDPLRITAAGATLLKECFDGPGVSEKLASGHTGVLFHRADSIVASFALSKSIIAQCFMAEPLPTTGDPNQQMVSTGPLTELDKEGEEPVPKTVTAGVVKAASVGDRPGTPNSMDLPSSSTDGSRSGTPGPKDSAMDPSNAFPIIGLMTRQARAVGYLPWVAWQWAIKHLGAAHPVASACLHDACVRTFPDSSPINPGSIEALSFARKEADAAVRTMLSMGVRAQLCTAVAVLGFARQEIESATASGAATQALRVQAARVQKEQSRSVSRAAQAAAANATAAGSKAISRRYIYVLADIEKLLLAHGPDDFESGRVVAPEMIEASNEVVVVDYDLETADSGANPDKEADPVPERGPESAIDDVEANVDTPSSFANEWTDAPSSKSALPPSQPSNSEAQTKAKTTTRMRALMHLYPTTLLPQHRSVWLLALRTLIVDSDIWRQLTASPVSPNAGRRFFIAASNIVRGLEQFGVPAAAFAALRARSPGGKALKSMSSSDSRETMLYVSWMDELISEEAEMATAKALAGGISTASAKISSPL
ncbi:hypothetical protein HDU67_007042 [Dinochytrium kinnereticum]|nr:hypothetical protein HDU67_007042 [Dinochytrium kinnereticum]